MNPRDVEGGITGDAVAASSPASGNEEKGLRMAFRNETETSMIETQERGRS